MGTLVGKVLFLLLATGMTWAHFRLTRVLGLSKGWQYYAVFAGLPATIGAVLLLAFGEKTTSYALSPISVLLWWAIVLKVSSGSMPLTEVEQDTGVKN